MATRYEIQVGDEIITFEGPDGMTEDQIVGLAEEHLRTAKPGMTLNVVYDPSKPWTKLPGSEISALPDSSAGGAFLRNLPHDAGFNWDDELAAIANAAIPGLAALDNASGVAGNQQSYWGADDDKGFWDIVHENQAAMDAQQQADDLSHPMASSAGRVAGVFSSLPRAGAAVAARLPVAAREAMAARPILTATGLSAAGGGVSAAGAGEGNRAQSAALGTLTGAAVGAGISGGIATAPIIAQYAKIFFGHGGDKEAVGQITKALQRDGFDVTSPSGVQALREELQRFTGKPVALADIGAATRARTGVGLRSPSKVQQQSIDQVLNRQAGQSHRLAEDVRQNVSPRTDVEALDQALVDQRAEIAKPLRERALYEEAPLPPPNVRPEVIEAPDALDAGLRRQMGQEVEPSYNQLPVPAPNEEVGRQARVVEDPVIQNLVRTPLGQAAMERALANSRGLYAIRAAQGLPTEETPYIADGANLDVRTLDAMKRYLDDEVGRLYRNGPSEPGSFQKSELKNLEELRNGLRDRMREVVPGYGEYLDAYSGSSEMIKALDEGQVYNNATPYNIAAGQAERSDASQELYRVGAARSLLDTLRNSRDNANPASRILNSDEARARLAATGVPEQNLNALNTAVGQERQLNLLPAELAGAQTDARAYARADANAGADFNLPFNVGSPTGWAGAAVRNVLNRVSVNRNAAVNEELLPRMLETDPSVVEGIIKELEDRGNIAAARSMKLRLRQRQIGGVGGVVIGGPVALPEDDYYGR